MNILTKLINIIFYLIIISLLIFGLIMLILLLNHKIRIIPNTSDITIIHPASL